MVSTPEHANAWPESKLVRTHLGDIEFRDVGEGPAIVFVHLVLADASHWDKTTPLLADRFRCILPTLPMGAHRVPADAHADLSPAGLARAVAELIDHVDVDDVTLVGNDSGGAISQVMAVNHPDRLSRVVLTNCDMFDDFPPRIFGYFKLLPYVPGSMAILGHALRFRRLWGLPFVFGRLTNDIDAAKVDRWREALLAGRQIRRDARKVFKAFGPQVTTRAARELRSTELPFLVAWGADDKAFKPALAERFCAEVPTAELVEIDDCRTFVCWDQPRRLAQLISDFVESRPDSPESARARKGPETGTATRH